MQCRIILNQTCIITNKFFAFKFVCNYDLLPFHISTAAASIQLHYFVWYFGSFYRKIPLSGNSAQRSQWWNKEASYLDHGGEIPKNFTNGRYGSHCCWDVSLILADWLLRGELNRWFFLNDKNKEINFFFTLYRSKTVLPILGKKKKILNKI